MVGLQKSNWGKNYYVNIGIWVNQFGAVATHKPHECHLWCRLDAIPETPEDISAALDEEDSWRMDAQHRQEVIRLALCNADFEFFRKLTTLREVLVLSRQCPFQGLAIRGELANAVGGGDFNVEDGGNS